MATPSLFQRGDFTLHSGLRSNFLIDCDALSDDDLACIAEQIYEHVLPFSGVVGIPRGGLRLAKALKPYTVFRNMRDLMLIVDDVCTTGSSFSEYVDSDPLFGGCVPGVDYIGACIFARGRCPSWVTPLFRMPEA